MKTVCYDTPKLYDAIVKGLVGDKTVNVLRDTGCEGVVVSHRLVEDSELTGKCCLIVRIDNAVLLAEKAKIKKPYLSGDVEALCIPEAICDLVVETFQVQGIQMTPICL